MGVYFGVKPTKFVIKKENLDLAFQRYKAFESKKENANYINSENRDDLQAAKSLIEIFDIWGYWCNIENGDITGIKSNGNGKPFDDKDFSINLTSFAQYIENGSIIELRSGQQAFFDRILDSGKWITVVPEYVGRHIAYDSKVEYGVFYELITNEDNRYLIPLPDFSDECCQWNGVYDWWEDKIDEAIAKGLF
ncbi:hypothetical protein [Zooshikella sp. RANM57]|uniref:hypothetical protein n=1 Tax=Zooshikella sp. RANM57 TaxID=3425863 RepID=UPI003D6DE2B1